MKRTSRWAKKDNIPGVSVLDLDGVIVLHADSALLKVHFVLLFYISGFLPFPLPTEDLFESPSLILFLSFLLLPNKRGFLLLWVSLALYFTFF